MHITSYKPGTPCWVDLGTPDIAGTQAFFGELFGWTGESDPDAGGYVIFNLNGHPVAGAGPLMGEDQPVVWTTYFATDDLDATATKIQEAGGQTLMPPMDVMTTGRMALFMDSSGAAFGAWQKIDFPGAQLVNEPGTLTWNELVTRDVDGSKDFYHKTLGLGAKKSEASDMPYTEFQVDGSSVGGMISMSDGPWPPDLPAHWMVYFAVADCDAAAEQIQKLGGNISVPPTDIPVGRFAVVSDPNGAFFSVITMNSN